MTQATLTLKDALLLLEIPNLDHVTKDSLASIRRKAYKRWHPDTLSGIDLSEEIKATYKRNAALINDAIDLIQNYINQDFSNIKNLIEDNKSKSQRNQKNTLREQAIDMQKILRMTLEMVRSQNLKSHERIVVVSEGISIKDALER